MPLAVCATHDVATYLPLVVHTTLDSAWHTK